MKFTQFLMELINPVFLFWKEHNTNLYFYCNITLYGVLVQICDVLLPENVSYLLLQNLDVVSKIFTPIFILVEPKFSTFVKNLLFFAEPVGCHSHICDVSVNLWMNPTEMQQPPSTIVVVELLIQIRNKLHA